MYMYYYVLLCNKEACFDTCNRTLRTKKNKNINYYISLIINQASFVEL